MHTMIERANEQAITELTTILHNSFDFMDPLVLKNNVSSILKNYQIEKMESSENKLDLQEKTAMYVAAKKIEGLSPATLAGYVMELNLFADYTRKHTRDIYAADVRAYLSSLENVQMSTIGKKLSTLKSFFSWLAAEEMIKSDPTLKVKLPKLEKKLPIYLTIQELEYLRECCATRRQRAMVEVFYATGCRLSEIWALNKDDIDIQTQSCVVHGKGNKERVVYFSHKAMYHLRKYLMNRTDQSDALFITERKYKGEVYRRMGKAAIQREFRVLAKRAGLQEKLTAHAMRRTFASLTLQNGAELAAIQELLGHNSPQTTLRYAAITEDKKREQHKKFLVQ